MALRAYPRREQNFDVWQPQDRFIGELIPCGFWCVIENEAFYVSTCSLRGCYGFAGPALSRE
jgi:hypothetical protein